MANRSTSKAQVQEPTPDDLDGLLVCHVHHCYANDLKGRLWAVADDASLAKLEGVTIEAMIQQKVIVSGADMVGPTVRALVKDGFMVEVDGRFRPTPAGVKRAEAIVRESGARIASDDQIKAAVRIILIAHPPPEISDTRRPRCGGVPVDDLPGDVETALCRERLSADAFNPKFRIESVFLDMVRSGEIERIEAGPETAYLDLYSRERLEDVWRLTVKVPESDNGQDQQEESNTIATPPTIKLSEAARLTQKSKKTLERLVGADKSAPKPIVTGVKGRAHLFAWEEMRKYLRDPQKTGIDIGSAPIPRKN